MFTFLNRAIVVAAFAVGTISGAGAQSGIPQIDTVLNDLHDAASRADYNRYFSHFADDAVFLGTDPAERWTTAQFRPYVKSRFDRGESWTYVPKERHVFLSRDGQIAWFDERLESAKYGDMRGTGVLVKSGRTWKLAQYNLFKPIPNDLFTTVVETIRTQTSAAPAK